MNTTIRSTKNTGKANGGPGGFHCPCCSPVKGATESKRFANRYNRRLANAAIKAVRNVTEEE